MPVLRFIPTEKCIILCVFQDDPFLIIEIGFGQTYKALDLFVGKPQFSAHGRMYCVSGRAAVCAGCNDPYFCRLCHVKRIA